MISHFHLATRLFTVTLLLSGYSAATHQAIAADKGDNPPTLEMVFPPKDITVNKQEITVEIEVADRGGGIPKLAVYQNGVRVLVEHQLVRKDGRVSYRFPLRLVEGENHLRFQVSGADGERESKPVERTVVFNKPLMKPDLYVVAIGISKYADRVLSLRFAHNDAKAMADLFQRRGSSLYNRVNVFLLLDDQATAANIRKTLNTAAKQADREDTLFLYLSGHGIRRGQRSYFVPHDFERRLASVEENVRLQAVPFDELADLLSRSQSLRRMVVADTAASWRAMEGLPAGGHPSDGSSERPKLPKGSVHPVADAEQIRADNGSPVRSATDETAAKDQEKRIIKSTDPFRDAISHLSRSRGFFVIGCGDQSDALEIPELKHGLLTYTLLAGLKAVDGGPLKDTWVKADDSSGVVNVFEWFGFAVKHIPRLSQQYRGIEQHVMMSSQGHSFPVLSLGD